MGRFQVDAARILDGDSFHRVFQEAIGFPEFDAGDMDAWIDGMTHIAEHEGKLEVEIVKAIGFRSRCPELFGEFIECTALVNHRFVEEGRPPPLALVFL